MSPTFRFERRYAGPIRLVILDWAGTVIDHGCLAPTEVFRAAFDGEGIDVTDDEVRGPMGMGKWEHIQTMTRMPSIAARWEDKFGHAPTDDDVDRMYQRFLPLQVERVREYTDLIPGTLDTIQSLRERGIAIGSSTGYPREVMDALVPLAAKAGYAPDEIITASDVHEGRPAPWAIYEIMRRTGVFPPEAVVKIDDSVSGIEAGLNAGAWTVGVAATGNLVGLSEDALRELPDEDRAARIDVARATLARAGAHFVIDSVAQLPRLLTRIEDGMR